MASGISSSAQRGPYAKSAGRRNAIIRSATAVFGAHGYHGGSLRQIAQQLGMSLTTLMHHFPTKAALLSAVLDQEDRSDPGFDDRARRDGFITTVLETVAANLHRKELVRMFSVVSAEATNPAHEAHRWLTRRYAETTARYAALIEHDRAAGRISADAPAERLAELVIGGWEGVQIRWLADGTDPVDAMERLLRLILQPPR